MATPLKYPCPSPQWLPHLTWLITPRVLLCSIYNYFLSDLLQALNTYNTDNSQIYLASSDLSPEFHPCVSNCLYADL